jgi:hypothetical protein
MSTRAPPGAQDVLPIVAATLPREAEALTTANLRGLAAGVGAPVLLLLDATSPAWAGDITRVLLATLTTAEMAILPGHGHVAIDSAPDLVVSELQRFFDDDGLPATVR